MILYAIKNNFKLMMRSATNTLLFIVSPIILIALLSSAFGDLMEKYESKDDIKAGYRVDADESDMNTRLLAEQLEVVSKDNGLILTQYGDIDPEIIIQQEDLAGFIVFEKGGTYTIYENGDQKYEAKALEYIVSSVDERIAQMIINAPEGAGALKMDESSPEAKVPEVKLNIDHPEYMEPISAIDYYGIIEVVYFGWCAIICGTGIFTAEKKYSIGKKLRVSGLSELKLYLAKFLPILLVVSVSSLITTGITILIFGVHWGSPAVSALIVVLSAAAATAFGLMFYSIFRNVVVTIIGVFAAVWVAGFWGGSFETYMFSITPQFLKNISPLYHINRALTELSCMGHSDYVKNAVIICLGITIVCSVISVLAGGIRRRMGE